MNNADSYRAVEAGYTLEWHDTPQLWVAHRYCHREDLGPSRSRGEVTWWTDGDDFL